MSELINESGHEMQVTPAKPVKKARKSWRFRRGSKEARDYTPVRFRSLFPVSEYRAFHRRALAALWPWRRRAYPGQYRLLGWLVGVSEPGTIETYSKLELLPRFRYAVIAERLEAKISELQALAFEARALAGDAPKASAPKVAPPEL